MQTKQPESSAGTQNASTNEQALNDAIRDYVRTYALWHGRPQAAQRFGVSRHTLWSFLERGHVGRSLPRAVVKAVSDYPGAVAVAEWAVTAIRRIQRRAAGTRSLAATQEDTLRLL